MLGEKLRTLRKKRNLTQEDLGNIFGLSASTIGMYEQNRRIPDLYTLEKIADFFNVPVDYLVKSDRKFPKCSDIEQNKCDEQEQYQKIISYVKAFFMDLNITEKEKEKLFKEITELFWKSKEMIKKY